MRTTTAASTELFDIDIAGELADGMEDAGGLLDATLVKRPSGTRTAGAIAGGTNATSTSLPCKGSRKEVAADGKREVTVSLLGASILSGTDRVVPEPGDDVTVGGETFEIVEVKHDRAAAMYTCICHAPGPGVR